MEAVTVSRRREGLEFSYRIRWEKDFDALAESIREVEGLRPNKICIVSDSNVAPLYLDDVKKALEGLGVKVFSWIFPAGEESKNLETVNGLYRFLIENHFERKDLLAALGGGVCGDLTGFSAATYLRGIDFIQIPTTLLAQVDSSVGGKTGVDFEQYKNMVGAFHQPRLVYMNMSTLETLPEEQFISGMGEVVKSAEIRSEELMSWIEDHVEEICGREVASMAHLIRECCLIKAGVVEEDPTEKGLRAILNFGHTLGHAIEKCRNFELLHGQCVGIGIAGAAWLSLKKGMISEADYQRIIDLNLAFGLPVKVSNLTADQILQASKNDKKMQEGKIKFILLEGIGNAVIDHSLTDEDLLRASEELIEG
ncbi:MAG: 3-dehydroquinate synthase [Eubacterium sp.]|nr:3-dehydroquinate synthase [Eubacterium sp.]